MEYLTKEKFSELKEELESLKTVKRKEVAEDLEYAKSLGDLSENAEYHEARDMQAAVEDRIIKLESLLQTAQSR
jgi:transcription elongation factor GreA